MNVAVMKTKTEQGLAEQFEKVADKLPGGAAIKALRSAAIGKFGALGLPHRRIEEWKYTDLRVGIKDVLQPAVSDQTPVSSGDLIVALGPLAHLDAYRMTFVNGNFRQDLSDWDGATGFEISPFFNALTSESQSSAIDPSVVTGPDADATIALNTALMTDGAVVRVTEQASPDKPMLVVFIRAGTTAQLMTVRNVIEAGPRSKSTIIEAHVMLPGSVADGQTNTLTELTVGEGGEIAHIKIAIDNGKSLHLANSNVALKADATYRGFQYTSGQAIARNQTHVTYAGEGGKLDLSGAFLVRGSEHIDTTLVVDHAVPHCESRELFKGVLDDRGRGVFQGKVIVRPDAQKTDGKQMAQVLMLSPDTEFNSKPELEIYADDVVCGHGTTSAQLDEDLLFYCMSRGIPQADARALLIESFIGEAMDKVEHEALRDALMQYARTWLTNDKS
jgi:Fe-S cluster assembly protein SufD